MKKLAVIVCTVVCICVAVPVYAQQVATSVPLENPSGINNFPDLLGKIVGWLSLILAPILTIVIIIGGMQMLTARDNEAQFKKGKATVTYAAIGAAIVLLASGIILVVKSFFTN